MEQNCIPISYKRRGTCKERFMKHKFLTRMAAITLGLAMAVGVSVGVANNRETIKLNAEGTAIPASNLSSSSNCTVSGTAGVKANKNVAATITVPKAAGNCDVTFHAAAWNGEGVAHNVTYTNATSSTSSITLTADSGVSGSGSAYTLSGNESDYEFTISLTQTSAASDMVINIAGVTNKRFVVWGASYESAGGVDPTPTTCTVTYHANGATSGSIPEDNTEYESGNSVTVLGNTGTLTKTGYIWSGWNTAANGTGTSYKAGSTFNITANTTLYARWINNYSTEDYVDITATYLNLPVYDSAYTAETLIHADDGMEFVAAPGGANKVYAITAADGTNDFDSASLSKVFMGKSGAYLYNKDPFPRSIDKVEVYASSGCSQSVSVAVDLGTTVRSSSYSANPTTLSTKDHIYTLKEGQASNNYTYFRLQVTNANNANIQIRISFSKPTTSVTVTPDSVTLNPNGTQQLTTTVLPADNTDTLSYLSSDGNVATVSSSGLITAVAVGTATITATSGSCSDTCVVTVELPADPYITPSKASTSGFTGAHETISFLYGNLGSDPLTVVSSNTGVITVEEPSCIDGSGTVQINFVGAGSTTVKFYAGASEMASLSVSVTASSVSISGLAASATAYVGKTLDLGSTITVNAVGIYSDDVTWSSENHLVAEVSASGVVTGVATGVVNITVTSDDYPSATMTCAVTVEVDTRWDTEFSTTMVADIVLPASGDTAEKYYVVAQITAITSTTFGNGNAVDENGTAFAIYGMYNFNGNLRYDSMPSEQKPIVGDFVVLYGVFTKFNNAPEIKNAWVMQRNGNVFQTPALTGITLNKENLLLGKDNQFTLTATPNPVDAEMPAVTWESSNDAIASVNSSGVVTGEAVGSATITATAGGFSATCNVTVSLSDTMIYDGGSTTNMAATGNAATVNLDSNLFTVNAAKGGNNNFPGLNTNGEIRAYNGNDIVVTINSEYTITSVAVDYQDGASYSQVYANNTLIAGSNGAYSINSDSFKIHANGGTIKINSAEIFYRNATAEEKVERLDTQTSLAYRYQKDGEGNFSYSDIVMRFGAEISKDLWDALDTDLHQITGFGVILMDGDLVTSADEAAYAIANGMVSSTVSESLDANMAIDYFVPIANMNEKIGSTANSYFWNLRVTVDESEMDKTYAAVAYIKVGDEYVLMNFARESVETLALDYLVNRDCNETTADGSLQNIVDNAA